MQMILNLKFIAFNALWQRRNTPVYNSCVEIKNNMFLTSSHYSEEVVKKRNL